jgi:hypothetical protein
VVATGAAAVAVWTGLPGGSHSGRAHVQLAALSFSTQGKYLVVKVKNPYADPKRYAKECTAHGMRIRLTMAPVSPSIVGTVVMMDGGEGIETITVKGKCWTGGGECVVFGRQARPGEPYTSTTSAFAAGEELHCVDVRGRTVTAVLALLGRHKMSVALYNDDPRPGWAENTRDPSRIPGGWYGHGRESVRPWAGPARGAAGEAGARPGLGVLPALFKGCR